MLRRVHAIFLAGSAAQSPPLTVAPADTVIALPGIAYDSPRDVVWVTLTGSNEVAGYHVAGEGPQERFRFPTVEQPNSVTVDPVSGRVIV